MHGARGELERILLSPGQAAGDPNDSPVRRWLRPRLPEDAWPPEARAVLVGVPFDGAVPGRPGARFGPAAVRAALNRLSTYDPVSDIDLAASLSVVDAGDVAVHPADALETHRRVEAVVAAIAASGAVPVVLGGDHSISFGTVRGAAAARGPLGVLQLDAHHDVRETHGGYVSSGTPFRRLLEERPCPVAAERFVQVGIAAWRNSPAYTRYVRERGIRVLGAADVHRRGVETVIDEALAVVSPDGQAFWLSVDLDVLDVAQAPGTSAHSPGGLTTAQLMAAVRAAARHEGCAGCDLVELAPDLDPGGWSAEVAAVIVMEFLAGLAERIRLKGRGP